VVAISTSVFNSYVEPRLADALGIVGQSDNLLNSLMGLVGELNTMPPELREQVRMILCGGYNRQMLVLCGSAAAQIPAALLMWKKDQLRV